MGDRICVMKDGIIQQFDTPQVLYDFPCNLFVAGFIGSPQMNFIPATIIKKDGKVCAHFDQFSLPLDEGKAKALAGYIDKEVLIGIRPEDFAEVASQPKDETITATVELAELMGAETNLYMDCAGTKLIVRMPSNVRPEEQKPYTVAVKVNKIHVFDKDTEKAICH